MLGGLVVRSLAIQRQQRFPYIAATATCASTPNKKIAVSKVLDPYQVTNTPYSTSCLFGLVTR